MTIGIMAICFLANAYNWDSIEEYEPFVHNPHIEWSFSSSANPHRYVDAFGLEEPPRIKGVRPYKSWKIDVDFTNCLQQVLKMSGSEKIRRVAYCIPFYGIDLDYDFQKDLHDAFRRENPSRYRYLMGLRWGKDEPHRILHNKIDYSSAVSAIEQSKVVRNIKHSLQKHGFNKFNYSFEKLSLLKPQNLFRVTLWIRGERTK